MTMFFEKDGSKKIKQRVMMNVITAGKRSMF
jgi:hypothetical protein